MRIGGHLTLWLLVSAISPCFSESNGESPRTGQAEHRVGLADSRLGYESTRFVTDSKVVLRHKGERLPLDELARDPPLGLPPLPMPLNSAEIDLGRSLFFDRRLSVNETLSCAMCHIPEQGFTQNELSTPVGHLGKGVRRNVPSLYNVAFSKVLFLDGRETSLEAQIWSPLLAANEMANPSRVAVLTKLSGIETYRRQFEELYPAGLTETTLGRALAAVRSLPDDRLEARRELVDLALPVRDDGGRRDHEIELLLILALGPEQQRDRLNRLTEAHVVGENAAAVQLVKEHEPREAFLLVRTKIGLEGARLRDARNLVDVLDLREERLR